MPTADIESPALGMTELVAWEGRTPRASGPTADPVLAVDGFEGPLDWLLDLARVHRIDLARLSIINLVSAFADALLAALAARGVDPLLLSRWGGWLVMAAELARLRSRLLLPADAAEGRAADWLDGRRQLGREVFGRGRSGEDGTPGRERFSDITALLRACLTAIRLPPDAEARYPVPGPPFWTVLDAAGRIKAVLPRLGTQGQALERFLPAIPLDAPRRDHRARTAVSATFLAGLELTRDGTTTLQQAETWGTIHVATAAPPAP